MEHTVAAIQQRWGTRAIRPARKADAPKRETALSTGFENIDRALGIGGFPRGRISELVGFGTAGQVTLAAKALYEAQRAGQQAVYVDMHQAIDLDFLSRCGVKMRQLAVLRPVGFRHAIEMTDDLIRGGGAGVIIFDRIHPLLAGTSDLYLFERALREWNTLLSQSLCTLLVLTEALFLDAYPAGPTLPHFASVRLAFEWQNWLYSREQFVGFVSRVTILKNRAGPSGRSLPIRVTFSNHIHGGGDE
jgi:recombination protein RecA